MNVVNVGGKTRIIVDGKLLDLSPKFIEKPGPRPAWVRASRATAVLEQIGTAEARALLKAMADGEADALPTRSAREALKRLGK